jgi:hypothetical protein
VVGVLWTIVFLLSRTSPAIRVAAFLAALSYVIFTTDADLADYFGSIPHAELLKSVAVCPDF